MRVVFEPSDPYDHAWAEFRRRERALHLCCWALVLVFLLAGLMALVEAWFGQNALFYLLGIAWMLVAFPSMIVLLVSFVSYTLLKCPRCGRNIFYYQILVLRSRDQCVHCGLHRDECMNEKKIILADE